MNDPLVKLALFVSLAFSAAAQAGPIQACDYSAKMDGVTCLVMVDGKVIYESYAGTGSPDKAWGLASGTKSFSGVAAAAAVQDGLFKLGMV